MALYRLIEDARYDRVMTITESFSDDLPPNICHPFRNNGQLRAETFPNYNVPGVLVVPGGGFSGGRGGVFLGVFWVVGADLIRMTQVALTDIADSHHPDNRIP